MCTCVNLIFQGYLYGFGCEYLQWTFSGIFDRLFYFLSKSAKWFSTISHYCFATFNVSNLHDAWHNYDAVSNLQSFFNFPHFLSIILHEYFLTPFSLSVLINTISVLIIDYFRKEDGNLKYFIFAEKLQCSLLFQVLSFTWKNFRILLLSKWGFWLYKIIFLVSN